MKLKKLASLAMSGVLCVSMLAACGGGSSSSAAVSGSAASGSASAEGTGNVTPVGEYPIVNEPITFKIMGAKSARRSGLERVGSIPALVRDHQHQL